MSANLTVPFDGGWTACVEGTPLELKRANDMFAALELPARRTGAKDRIAALAAGDCRRRGFDCCTKKNTIFLKNSLP